MTAKPPDELLKELGASPVTLDRTRVAIEASSLSPAEEFAAADLGIVSLGFGVVAFLKDANTRLGSEALAAIPNDTVLLALLPVKPAGFDPDTFE